jgi:hypothetical protein
MTENELGQTEPTADAKSKQTFWKICVYCSIPFRPCCCASSRFRPALVPLQRTYHQCLVVAKFFAMCKRRGVQRTRWISQANSTSGQNMWVKPTYKTRNCDLTAITHTFCAICQQRAIYMNSFTILSPVWPYSQFSLLEFAAGSNTRAVGRN